LLVQSGDMLYELYARNRIEPELSAEIERSAQRQIHAERLPLSAAGVVSRAAYRVVGKPVSRRA
jgi:hypothetical protein